MPTETNIGITCTACGEEITTGSKFLVIHSGTYGADFQIKIFCEHTIERAKELIKYVPPIGIAGSSNCLAEIIRDQITKECKHDS
jgi:uncharacterized protein (UPF0212 family)